MPARAQVSTSAVFSWWIKPSRISSGRGAGDHVLQGGKAGDGCVARAERVVVFDQADDVPVVRLQGGLDHAADVAVVDAHDADAHDEYS